MNITQKRAVAKEIKDNLLIGEILDTGSDFEYLNEYFKLHPNYNEKFNNGCTGFIKRNKTEWGKNSECLHIIDEDLNEISISVNFPLSINKKAEVIKAFRNSIHSEIITFKKNFVKGVTKCEISNKIINEWEDINIDHHNLDFTNIVEKFIFLNNYNFESIYENIIYDDSVTLFNDFEFRDKFIKFHNENTTLRFTLKNENQKKVLPKLRDYQIELSSKAVEILQDKKIVYLNMQPRTGKTLTALNVAKLYGSKNVLFITKKKAINSIQDDYNNFNFIFNITIINAESLHKVEDKYDLIISDEHHGNGAFPKPSNRTKLFKLKYSYLPMIFLSGTMSTESGSQIFHQFWVSYYSPFKEYGNFYKWSKTFVNVTEKHLGYGVVKDYSDAKMNLINPIIDEYTIKYTQEDSGFKSKVNINILHCEKINETLIKRLKKDLVIEGKQEVILADTGAKLMQKIHQLENGTIKFESGNTKVLDYSKAEFIRDKFKDKKIAIFYYYIAEFELLKETFKNYTTDIEEFNNSDKTYIGQQYSNAMGINLSSADSLVFYNFGFSGTNFIQSIDRLTTINRLENNVYFVYPKGSLTEKIHNVVKNKKNFTESQFKKTL
jgi:hypothetical protein